jgi:hypothetical protein
METPDTPETPTPLLSTETALGIDVGLLVVICVGGCALVCTCLLWLGERRARAESEANARAFRTAAILRETQTQAESAQPAGASAHATAHLEHVSIGVARMPVS